MELGVWDLTALYKTNEQFLNDYKSAEKYLENVKKFRGKLSKKDPKVILDYFKMNDKFSLILEKIAVYAFLKRDDDGKNVESVKNYAMVDNFCTKASEELAFVRPELSELDDEFLKTLQNSPEFKDFDRVIEGVIRLKKHSLDENGEKNVAAVGGVCNSSDVYTTLSNVEMNHGEYENEKGEIIKLSPGTYNMHLNNPNSEIRKRVMENYLAEYGNLNQTFAGLFVSHIKLENYLAKQYKFDSVLDMKCHGEEVSPNIMYAVIKSTKKHIHLLQKYFEAKKEVLKLSDFYTSDIPVSVDICEKVNISYEEAIDGIRESLAPLGQDYVNMFDHAVTNGWIDAFPRENKRSGGYTTSTYKEHPYILLNFDGTLDWASAITHEFGHAMHSLYSAKAQPYSKCEYTLFVAEIVSLTNEILYNKHLLQKAKTKAEKVKILVNFLQLFQLNVFDSVMLAEFELFVHDALWRGGILTAEDLNEKYRKLCKTYFGKNVKLVNGYEFNWSRKAHIFRDYYLYKYAMGLCAACFVAKNILKPKNEKFVKDYKAFLSLGDSLNPMESLKVAGIDVLDNKIYDEAFSMFEEYLNELKKLTKEKL